jgi:hypothetical protein
LQKAASLFPGFSISQGDQFGRIFCLLGNCFYFGHFLKITKIAYICGLLFYTEKCYALILTKNGLGFIWGNFFTNLSGHPAHNPKLQSPRWQAETITLEHAVRDHESMLENLKYFRRTFVPTISTQHTAIFAAGRK